MSKFPKRNNKSAKLTASMVADIREKYSSGGYTQSSLCALYDMSIGQIGRIVRGESWRPGPGDRQILPMAAELDEIGKRMALVQVERDRVGVPEPLPPAPAEPRLDIQAAFDRFRDPAPTATTPPLSPIDGGDAPSEADGSATAKMQETMQRHNGSLEGLVDDKSE